MRKCLLLVFFISTRLLAQMPSLKISCIGDSSSFRGLSVVDDQVVWLSGSSGTVCRSTDSGITFDCNHVAGFDSADFRSIYAFDALNAIICNIGSPANILLTSDGGKTWKVVYQNENPEAFIDGIDFWNSLDGIVIGDPVDGIMMQLNTTDGGNSWNEISEASGVQLVPGEAFFAASGTSVRCFADSIVRVASGGSVSRLFTSTDKGKTWTFAATPILQGKPSTGTFSLAFFDHQKGIIAGGDYKEDTLSRDHIFLTLDGGRNWQFPSRPTRGYRECVEFISSRQVIAAGPSGIDYSQNGGLTWVALSDEKNFHTLRKARNGTLVILAGSKGKVGRMADDKK